MHEEHNYYEEMGIPFDAADDQIKEAYKKLAKKYHPDLNPDMPQWSANQMKKLNLMYNTLIDPVKRRGYDRKIGKLHPSSAPFRPPGHARQWKEARYKSQSKQTTTKKPYNVSLGFSGSTLKTAAFGMLAAGLAAFLLLTFLPIKAPEDIQWTAGNKRPHRKIVKKVPRTKILESGGFDSIPDEKVKPPNAEAHYDKGVELLQKGRFDDAITEFEQAVKDGPEHFRAHAYLGFTYDVKGRLDEAIHEYEKAIDINPDFADAYYGLYVIYEKKGMFSRAERELEIYNWLTGENAE